MQFAYILLSLAAGIMLEAVFGFFIPDNADAALKVVLAIGGFSCLAMAIFLAYRQESNARKEAGDARRQADEHKRQILIYHHTMVNMLRRMDRRRSPSKETSQPKPMKPLTSRMKKEL